MKAIGGERFFCETETKSPLTHPHDQLGGIRVFHNFETHPQNLLTNENQEFIVLTSSFEWQKKNGGKGMLTAKDSVKLIGQVKCVSFGGMLIEVKIVDVKWVYGKTRFQITPVKGQGLVWVENLS